MSDQGMFNDDTNQETADDQSATPPKQDLFADKLREITKEDGSPKYADVETALGALKESQSFIKKLQEENKTRDEELAKLRSEVEKRQSVDEAVERLLGSSQKKGGESDPTPNPGLDAKTVEELIQRNLSQQEQKKLAEQNLRSVETQMTEWYGDEAARVIAQKAKELETSPSKLQELARENPKLALQIFSGAQTGKPQSTKSSQVPPRKEADTNEMPTSERSMIRGGMTNKELAEHWRKVQSYTNKRLGVET